MLIAAEQGLSSARLRASMEHLDVEEQASSVEDQQQTTPEPQSTLDQTIDQLNGSADKLKELALSGQQVRGIFPSFDAYVFHSIYGYQPLI